jgi:hypothetical protein
MKLAKSLLLGSAAALAATAGAQAADLPYKKAAPVEYVRVCDWTGVGYFYIPGTDTCLKIGGFVRAEFEYVSGGRAFVPANAAGGFGQTGGVANGGTYISGRNRDETGFVVRGRVTTDARTQTAYGTLRTYIQIQADRASGAEFTNSGIGASGQPQGSSSNTYIDKAFIQFAGISAGRMQSYFDFLADPYGFDGVATTDSSSQLFAYTATFAGGFSATLSVEDPNPRRYGINNSLTANGVTTANYQGDRVPDIIGVLRVDQAWGAAQLSGAYHQLTTTEPVASATSFASKKDDEGWAVHGGLQIKLPMLAAGDEFSLEAGYENGAFSYVNSNTTMGGYGSPIVVGGYQHASPDAIAIANAAGGYTLAKAESYGVSGGFVHYITPNFNAITFGSYEHVSYGAAGRIQWFNGGEGPSDSYRIAEQFNWIPVKDLDIGIEFMYIKVDQKIPGTPGNAVGTLPVAALPAGIKKDPDAFTTRLRIERDF